MNIEGFGKITKTLFVLIIDDGDTYTLREAPGSAGTIG
jgi:hypothetical protein